EQYVRPAREDRAIHESVGGRPEVHGVVPREPVLVDAVPRQVEREGGARGVERRLVERPLCEPVAVEIEVGDALRERGEREAGGLALERLAAPSAAQTERGQDHRRGGDRE